VCHAVILVLASRHDAVAHRLVASWSAFDAALLTPESLSTRGWWHRVGAPHEGRLVIAPDRVVEVAHLQGVYTRLSHVTESELPHIVETDRAYVAAEMTAFLLDWLSELPCRVVNRPTPSCLAGPYWRPERWVHVAAAAGLPVRATERVVPGEDQGMGAADAVTITVVGDQWYGQASAHDGAQAIRLARLAGADVLQLSFEQDLDRTLCFTGADVWPDLDVPGMAAALASHILG